MVVVGVGMPQNPRGFVDKTEAMLAPGSVQMYSSVVYSVMSMCVCVCVFQG